MMMRIIIMMRCEISTDDNGENGEKIDSGYGCRNSNWRGKSFFAPCRDLRSKSLLIITFKIILYSNIRIFLVKCPNSLFDLPGNKRQ